MYKWWVFKAKHISSGTKIIKHWKVFQTFASTVCVLSITRVSFKKWVVFIHCCNVTFTLKEKFAFTSDQSLYWKEKLYILPTDILLFFCQNCIKCLVQFSRSVVSDSLRPHESQHARPPCPSPTPGSSLRLTSIESVMPSTYLILCRPLLLLLPIPPSIRVFSNESTLY